MAFKGWKAEAIEFFEGLEADNSKSYWTAHKHEYEEYVLAPMQELLSELSGEFGEPKIFRPYRDVRFSKDKSPYKANIAGVLSKGGYLHLDTGGFGVGCGMYMMAGDQIGRFRAAVADDETGPQLESIIAELRKGGITVGTHGELKTAPKGYPKDHPRIELLRYKDLTSWKHWDVGPWLGTAKVKKGVTDFFRHCEPMNHWLSSHVGDSQLEESGRR
ncbi:MAG TPA: DUF2461 domain-containing protein [Acidimicrobiales bacterium]|jgi:uncharacterized protein (TIGR02453 family)|nr:DUF2461 domain-containing protein [Acidimicrobiales bacterium]